MDKLKFIIAKNIQKLRIEREMTQQQLAEVLNYSDKTISKWERGESLPDIIILKQLSDYFGVSLDYLTEEEHQNTKEKTLEKKTSKRNYYILTAISIFLVFLIATLIFYILKILLPGTIYPWLCYGYAVPLALVVWLVFNSIWFDPRKNYVIISFLVWSLLASLFLTFYMIGYEIWPILLVGIPAQIVIILWSGLKGKKVEE